MLQKGVSLRERTYEPESFKTSSTTELVSLLSRLDPAALGWIAAMSPDRPIPWISLRQTGAGQQLPEQQAKAKRCSEGVLLTMTPFVCVLHLLALSASGDVNKFLNILQEYVE